MGHWNSKNQPPTSLEPGRNCPGQPSTRYSTEQEEVRERGLRILARCIAHAHLRRACWGDRNNGPIEGLTKDSPRA